MPLRGFNIFRALRLEGHEVRHSNFLGWLLDPSESHGQGDLFLQSFITVIEHPALRPHQSSFRPGMLQDAQVSREVDQLDLRIVLPGPRVVLAVENKLFTSEHSEQLARYADALARDFPGWQAVLLYLTLDADPPSDHRWHPLSHRQVTIAIEDALGRLINQPALELVAFVQHYLDLLADIYARRNAATQNPRLPHVLDTISEAVTDRIGWHLLERTSGSVIECGPQKLFEALPPIGTQRGRGPRELLTLRFHDHGARGYVGRYWRPSEVADTRLRNIVLRALVEHGPATGFRYKPGALESGLAGRTPAFSGDRIQDLRTGTVPEPTLLKGLVERELIAIEARLSTITGVIHNALASA